MRVVSCHGDGIREYIKFCRNVYDCDIYYRDSLTGILKTILYNKGAFCKDAGIEPVLIYDDEGIAAAGTFITTGRLPGVLQIAFFEARKNKEEAVGLLVSAAREKCRTLKLDKIVIGLNGHVNYGFGLLSDHFDSRACFGCSYNPDYYIDYFERLGAGEYKLVSYLTDMRGYNLDREQRLLERVNKGFTFRAADFKRLDREVNIYTELNNRCFKDHPFYFERTIEEDYELLNQFKLFISGENLLIAEKDGKPVGFMLWYPDFNQLVNPGKEIGFGTYIKNKLFSHRIDRFKIAEIGVVPEYQGSGVILGLFDKCMQLTKGRYDWCEAGWILDSNKKSRGFGIRWADREYKHYKVFELSV